MIGIYKITNIFNGKAYIGQSLDIEKRWRFHQKYKTNHHLNSSIHYYGVENFKFEILREISQGELTNILLDVFEKFYIEKYETTNPLKGYNLKEGGGSRGSPNEETRKRISHANKGKIAWNKSKPLSIAHKKAISEAHKRGAYNNVPPLSQEAREKISKKNKGKTHITTLETREKLRKALLGKNKGKKASEETKKKLSEGHKKRTMEAKKAFAEMVSKRFKGKPWSQARREAEVKRKQQMEENQN